MPWRCFHERFAPVPLYLATIQSARPPPRFVASRACIRPWQRPRAGVCTRSVATCRDVDSVRLLHYTCRRIAVALQPACIAYEAEKLKFPMVKTDVSGSSANIVEGFSERFNVVLDR